MNALTAYRVNYECHIRGRWHPSSCGAMDRGQAEQTAADLTSKPDAYRDVRITNDMDV
jgi:hypothetical protein